MERPSLHDLYRLAPTGSCSEKDSVKILWGLGKTEELFGQSLCVACHEG